MGALSSKNEISVKPIGREARQPTQIPKAGWRDVIIRTYQEIEIDHIDIVAAGIAFYIFLSIFPCLAALISLYGLVSSPGEVELLFESIQWLLPGDTYEVIKNEIIRLSTREVTAGWGAVSGLLLALWGGSKAAKAMLEGINIAYEQVERRGFIKLNVMGLVLTLVGILYTICCLLLIVGIPTLLNFVPLGAWLAKLLDYARWPLLAVMVMFGLGVLYRYGPCRSQPKWRWVSVGSVLASVLWLIASALFSLYVSNFGDYNKVYGPIASLVVFMLWLYITAFVTLLGAELNAELELQTAQDSTAGNPKPLGERGAFVADHVGKHFE